jgi:hypothetical protein
MQWHAVVMFHISWRATGEFNVDSTQHVFTDPEMHCRIE